MNNNTKTNDWVVAQMDNPTFDLQNFKDVGLSADNTVLQDRNTYKNSQYVQDRFQSDGKFDETAFNKFYDNAVASYQAFANNQFEDEILSDIEFDPYNALRPKGAETKTRDIGFNIVKVQNPNRLKTSISRVGRTDEQEWSISELAQKERVFNYDTKQWEDYTPNDRTLFGNLGGFISSLSEPLVIAQWDSEGYHTDPYTGRRIKHKKGDYKYNEDGNYYYETLGGREAYGKQFKSVFDSFTVDGSKGNKYDFFDSDGLDKSVTGTVMKTVTTLAPLFIPGVNGYYGAALVGANLLDILPSLYKSTLGLVSDGDTPLLNNIQGIGRTLKQGKSEYSQNHLLSTENFFDLVTDVSLQWAQQRAIFSAFNKLSGNSKLYKNAAEEASKMTTANLEAKNAKIAADLETKLGRPLTLQEQAMVKMGAYSNAEQVGEMAMLMQNNKLKPLLEANNRMAADAALGYMATMSGIDSFESAIEQGADRTEAAAVAWGTIAGMFVWDRTGIGEIFFPELKGEQQSYQKAIDSVAKEITKGFGPVSKAAATEGRKKSLAKLFNWAKNKSSDFWKQVNDHSLTFAGKAFGEGIEEVGEEVISDFFKSTYNWAEEFGWTKTNTHLDAWDNMAARYGMSFFGGALGGAIFAGVDLVQNGKNSEQLNQELIYLIRNGRSNELLEELDKMREKGKLGNKNLSATKYEINAKDPSSPNWLSPTSSTDNQNEATYNLTKNYIQSLDTIIHQEGLAYSDQELLDRMVMGDQRMKSLLSFGKVGDDTFGPLMVDGYNGKLLQDWNTLCSNLLKIDQELEALEKGIINGNKEYIDDAALQKAKSDDNSAYNIAKNRLLNGDGKVKGKMQLLEERDKFLNGQYSQHYVDQMLFFIDDDVNKYFFTPTFKDYAEYQTNQKFEDIAPDQIEALKPKYEAFKGSTKTEAMDTAYEIFKNINKKGSQQVGQQGEIYENFLRARNIAREQLIDLELTKQKLDSVHSGDIETIDDLFRTIPGRNSIMPELREQFKMVSTDVDPNASPEDQAMQRGIAETINTEALKNIRGIVEQFKKIGFIDTQTKNLLLNAIKTPFPQEIVQNTINALINKSAEDINSTMVFIDETDEYKEFYDKVNNILMNITPDNIEESKTAIKELFNTKEAETWSFLQGDFYNVLDTDQYLNNALNTYLQIVDNVASAFRNNPILQTVEQLKSDIISISDNPIYKLIQQFSVNTYGRPVEVFDVIEQENTRLGNVQSLSEYILDPTAESQIDQGLTVLDMVEAVINASSTHEFNSNEPYGHNQTINYFLEKYFPQEEKLGIVRQDLAAKMKEDVADVRKQLLFLKELSRINAVNQFSKHKLTGKAITKLMSDILRGNGRYGFLKDIEYKGHKLFEGIDELPTSALDAEQVTDEIYVQADQLQDLVYDNFEKIVEATGESRTKVFKGLFANLKQMFSADSLVNQRNSQFDPQTKSLEDFDVFLWLTSLMSLKKSDFNYYLREVLKDDKIKFAPLFSQEYTAQMAVSFLVDPELLNAAIDLIKPESGEAGEELLLLKNLIMINGIGGAGKTSVVAKIVNMIRTKLYPDSTIWKVGPTKEQSKNLTVALGSQGPEFDIDGLMKKILGEQEYGELQNDVNNRAKTSKYYTIDTYKNPQGVEVYVARANKLDYSNTDIPKIVFLDEATHINSVYLQHLTNWAQENGVLIVAMGDLIQNGFNDSEGGFLNINSNSTLAVRTPKLNISMRINNIQKDNNTKTEVAIIDFIQKDIDLFVKQLGTYSPEQVDAETIKKAAEYAQFVKDNLKFHRFTDENNPLNGEMLAQSLDTNLLEKMLAKGNVGVVYDNTSSPTYKLLQQYVKDHPDAKIDFFTPKEVQGSERDYFIIDIDFNKVNLSGNNPLESIYFMTNTYTMQTRSKVGTVFIDNGLSKLLPQENWVIDDYTNLTPNPEQIIKDFRDNKLEILDATLGDYMPNILPQDGEADEDNSEPPSNPPSTTPPSSNPPSTNPPSTPTINPPSSTIPPSTPPANPPGSTNPPAAPPAVAPSSSVPPSSGGNSPAVQPTTEAISTSTGNNVPMAQGEDGISKEFLERIEAERENPIALNHDAPIALTGIRAYGWYMRYGVNVEQKKFGDVTYNSITFRQNPEEGVIDDLNAFLDPDLEYTDAELNRWSERKDKLNSIHNAQEMLKTVRNYITFGQKFDQDFIDLIKKRSSDDNAVLSAFATFGKDEQYALDVWNNGTFKLQVRKNDETFDKAVDKNGYDASKVEPVAFNLIYEIKLGKNRYQFTIGKLPNPATWEAYINSTDPKTQESFEKQLKVSGKTKNQVQKSYEAYEKWYRDLTQHIMSHENEIKYFDVPKEAIKFQAATRLVAIPDSEGKKKFDLSQFYHDNPNAIRSQLYIYSGKKGELSHIKDSVRGKAIVFVAANRDLKVDGERITSENIASLYIRQQMTNSTPVIRMMIVNPKGMYMFSSKKSQGNIEGYLDMNYRFIEDEDGQTKFDQKAFKEKLSTVGSINTGARMIIALWNYRAGIIRINELLAKYPNKTAAEINDIIESDAKLKEMEFRLEEPSTSGYGMGTKWNGVKGDGSRQLVTITAAQAKTQKAFLDHLIELMRNFTTLPKETDARWSISSDRSKKNRFDYNEIIEDLENNDSSLVLDTPKGKLKTKAFQKAGAFKVVTLLSAIARLYADPKNTFKSANYIMHTTDLNGENIQLGLEPLSVVIAESLKANGLRSKTAPSTFIHNTLNMIFHGVLNPYASQNNIPREFAPFKHGIFYHPRYDSGDKSRPIADFFPCKNLDSQFTYDVAIENSNMEIDINLTKLKESASGKIEEQMNSDVIRLQVQNFTRQIESLRLPFFDKVMKDIQDSHIFDSRTEADLNNTLNLLFDKVVAKLNRAVATGEFKINNDPVMKAELIRDEHGNIDMKYSTLLGMIKQKNAAIIPIAADGFIDYTQIANIEYTAGNDGNFVVTLSNGDNISGTINGDVITIEDQNKQSSAVQEDSIFSINDPKAHDLAMEALDPLQKLKKKGLTLEQTNMIEPVEQLILHLTGIAPLETIQTATDLFNAIIDAEGELENLIGDLDIEVNSPLDKFYNYLLELEMNEETTKNSMCKIPILPPF